MTEPRDARAEYEALDEPCIDEALRRDLRELSRDDMVALIAAWRRRRPAILAMERR